MSTIAKAQQILEQNEDMMAAIVENMQLGRLEDCIKQYAYLHRNLISLAHDLDNYPSIDVDPFLSANEFPDKIMRKDILDDIRPPGSILLPKPPLPSPCAECARAKLSAAECREKRQHVAPTAKFSTTEKEEYIHASNILSDRHRQYIIERMAGKSKRPYKRWNNSEKYTLMVAMRLLGVKDTHRIAELMEDRSENQVRSFISHNFDAQTLEDISEGRLPPPPPRYQPPPKMVLLFADPSSQSRLKGLLWGQDQFASAFSPTSASMVGGWNTLLCIALGLPQDFSSNSSSQYNAAAITDDDAMATSIMSSMGNTNTITGDHLHSSGPMASSQNYELSQNISSAMINLVNKPVVPPWLVINVEDSESAGKSNNIHHDAYSSFAEPSCANVPEMESSSILSYADRFDASFDAPSHGSLQPSNSFDPIQESCLQGNSMYQDMYSQIGHKKKTRTGAPVVTMNYGALHGLLQGSSGAQIPTAVDNNNKVSSDEVPGNASGVIPYIGTKPGGKYGLFPKVKKPHETRYRNASNNSSNSVTAASESNVIKRKYRNSSQDTSEERNVSEKKRKMKSVSRSYQDDNEAGREEHQKMDERRSSSASKLRSSRVDLFANLDSNDSADILFDKIAEKKKSKKSPKTMSSNIGEGASTSNKMRNKQQVTEASNEPRKSKSNKTKNASFVLTTALGNITPPSVPLLDETSNLANVFSPTWREDSDASSHSILRLTELSSDGHNEFDGRNGYYLPNAENVTLQGFEDGTSFFGSSNFFLDCADPSSNSNMGTNM